MTLALELPISGRPTSIGQQARARDVADFKRIGQGCNRYFISLFPFLDDVFELQKFLSWIQPLLCIAWTLWRVVPSGLAVDAGFTNPAKFAR
jgi:hypothetical protein